MAYSVYNAKKDTQIEFLKFYVALYKLSLLHQ